MMYKETMLSRREYLTTSGLAVGPPRRASVIIIVEYAAQMSIARLSEYATGPDPEPAEQAVKKKTDGQPMSDLG